MARQSEWYVVELMTDTTDARLEYKDKGGEAREVVPVVLVGTVDAQGIPRMLSGVGNSPVDLSGYLTIADAASKYVPLSSMTGYLTTDSAATTYATISGLNDAVVKALGTIEYSITGDISVAGSSIAMSIGDSGINATLAYSAAGAASLTFNSASGTISPVDIRRNTIWGGSAVETYTLDNGSLDTTGVVADSTIYTNSQDCSAYFIRVQGTIYFLTIWASAGGARSFMGIHKMI